MPKYRFSGGTGKIILQKSYTDTVRNASGNAITTKFVPAIKAVFNNGHFETDDDLTAKLLSEHEWFGTQFYWHPTMEGKVPTFDKKKSKPIEDTKQALAMRKKKARDARLESGMRAEDT